MQSKNKQQYNSTVSKNSIRLEEEEEEEDRTIEKSEVLMARYILTVPCRVFYFQFFASSSLRYRAETVRSTKNRKKYD